MKAKIALKKIKKDGYWTVRFTIGVQTFTLDIGEDRTKEEAIWYKLQLQTAFDSLGNRTN